MRTRPKRVGRRLTVRLAVAAYAVLYDVRVFLHPPPRRMALKKESDFVFFVWGEGQRGTKGVNARSPKHLIILLYLFNFKDIKKH